MLRAIIQRLIDAVPTILLVLTLVFLALHVLPGDPAQTILGDQATAAQLAQHQAQQAAQAAARQGEQPQVNGNAAPQPQGQSTPSFSRTEGEEEGEEADAE